MPYSALAAALFSIVLCALALFLPIRAHLSVAQRGICLRMRVDISAFGGLVRVPLRFTLEFESALLKLTAAGGKKPLTFFRITRRGEKKALKRKPKRERLPRAPLLRAVTLKKLMLGGELALDDAALCTALSGTLNMLFTSVLRIFFEFLPVNAEKARISSAVEPKFTENALRLDLDGILSTNAVKLIRGFVKASLEKRSRLGKAPVQHNKRRENKVRKGEKPCTLSKT